VKVDRWPLFVAVKCGWFASLDSDKRGRSFVARGGGGGEVVDGTGDDEAHRDGLMAAGDSVKRSRDYRTSSRSNVTVSAAAVSTVTFTSTTMTTSLTSIVLIVGRTS